MDVLEAVENETLESHDGDIGYNGHIGDRAKQGLVVQLVRTRRSHRRGHRFESCQDHKKQEILLENNAKTPKITACCRNRKDPPLKLGR